MSRPGLAFTQGPPFTAPLRFFLTTPLFLMVAALAAIPLAPEWTASRWTPAALALTHLLTLGFLGLVMVGSLLQMLPVVIGSPVPAVMAVTRSAHLGLTAGTLLLAAGLWQMEPAWIQAGLVALAVGWVPFVIAAGLSLLRAPATAKIVLNPMRKAWLALLVTLGLGIYLAGGLSGLWPLQSPQALTGLHAGWGLIGWVTILIVGVAYHVVPMLQLTPPYRPALTRWLSWALLAGLILYSLSFFLPERQATWALVVAWLLSGLGVAAFALVTLDIQHHRRRKLPDASLDFWRYALAGVILLVAVSPLAVFLPEPWQGPMQVSLGLMFLLGFVVSIVHGMIYKIVPFLAWFHLQTQTRARAGTIPNMKEFIPDAAVRRHLRQHVAAVLLLLPAPFLPAAASVPGLLLLAWSAHELWLNLLHARRLFLDYGGMLV